MQITISGQQLEITTALREHVTSRVEKVLSHFDHVISAQVVLHIENEDHVAEATVHTKGASLHATGKESSMYPAIDAMAAKLDRQVLKHKDKTSDHHQAEGGLSAHSTE